MENSGVLFWRSTAKKGSTTSPQKCARPAVSTTVAATAAQERKEMVRTTVSSRLIIRMASRVSPMLVSMSRNITAITL